jgi:tetratricopeptide (TPR) repeat protein
MAIDQYQLCSCGSGKKYKFCCSKDIISDLDKISRTIEGGQTLTAIDQLDQLAAKKKLRPTILVLKCGQLLRLKRIKEAQEVVTQLLEFRPVTSMAYALAATVAALRGDVAEAIEKLQRSLEISVTGQPSAAGESMYLIANLLYLRRDPLGARAYLELILRQTPELDPVLKVSERLQEMQGQEAIHPILNQSLYVVDGPADAAWIGEFNQAKDLAEQDRWWRSLELFEELASRYPLEPAILHNLAILRSRLGNAVLSSAAWRKYSQTPGVALEDAVEAEAIAELLDPNDPWKIGVRHDVYEIPDAESLQRLEECLSSHPRVILDSQDDLDIYRDENNVPAKMGGAVLRSADHPWTIHVGTKPIRTILCTFAVYGKQTDKPARIVFQAADLSHTAADMQQLRELLKGYLSSDPTTTVDSHRVPVAQRMLLNTAVEELLVGDTFQQHNEKLHDLINLDLWLNNKWSALDNKTPKEVAADPAYRLRLLAGILRMELTELARLNPWDFNKLRSQLGLPTLATFNLQDSGMTNLPIIRLHRLETESLTDNHLEVLLDFATSNSLVMAARRFAQELLRRDSNIEVEAKYKAFNFLATTSPDPEELGRYQEEAYRLSKELGEVQLIQGLRLLRTCLELKRNDRVQSLVRESYAYAGSDPEKKNLVDYALVQMGLLARDPVTGRPTLVGPAAPTSESKIWTPGSGVAAPLASGAASGSGSAAAGGVGGAKAGDASKSKLWLPGMD